MLGMIVLFVTTGLFSYYSGVIDKASDCNGLVIGRN